MPVKLTTSGAVKANIRGQDQLRKNIATLRQIFQVETDRAMKSEAQDILNDAKDNYVPEDMGDLKASGKVVNVLRGTGREVAVQFGGTPETEPYAIAVHEHLSAASPPSWQGKPILNWTKQGTGPKYLEIPFQKAEAGMLSRIAAHIHKSIASVFP